MYIQDSEGYKSYINKECDLLERRDIFIITEDKGLKFDKHHSDYTDAFLNVNS